MRAGIEPVLVTDGNARAAARVASSTGISNDRAEIRPECKAAIIRDPQTDGQRIAMLGDGVNDAALMQSHVGIAAGQHSDIPVDAADIVLLGTQLDAVVHAGIISLNAYGRTSINVAPAFVFNGVGVPLATTGLVYPLWAMVAMAASVTAIFINSFGGQPVLLFDAISSVRARRNREHASAGRTPAGTRIRPQA